MINLHFRIRIEASFQNTTVEIQQALQHQQLQYNPLLVLFFKFLTFMLHLPKPQQQQSLPQVMVPLMKIMVEASFLVEKCLAIETDVRKVQVC
jgi:hypothetical protein